MLGFLSFLAFCFGIAFVVSVVLLVVRTVRHKPRKPFLILAAVSVVAVIGLSVPISQMYVPAEKPESVAVETAEPEQPDASEFPDAPSVTEDESADAVEEGEPVNDAVSEDVPSSPASGFVDNSVDDSAKTKNHKDVSNPLLEAEFQKNDVWNGTKTEVIGEYGFVSLPDVSFDDLESQQILDFALEYVQDSGLNWVSVFLDDGTGICFIGSSIINCVYGDMDSDGSVTKTKITLLYGDDGYSYIPADEGPVSFSEGEPEEESTDDAPAPSLAETYKTDVIVACSMLLDRFLSDYKVSLAPQSWTVADFDSDGAVAASADVKFKSSGSVKRCFIVLTPIVTDGKCTETKPHYVAVGSTVYGDDGYCDGVFSKIQEALDSLGGGGE